MPLKTAQPRLNILANRLSYGDNTEGRRKRDRLRYTEDTWRKWYKSKAWADLRDEVLNRDYWTCRQTGVLLSGKWPAPNSPVVDHIKPHKGDPKLFWDIDNLQAVSRKYHDGEKRKIERSGNA